MCCCPTGASSRPRRSSATSNFNYYNYGQRTLGTFIDDVERKGIADTVADRLEWGTMRMTPTDVLDVSGATYTYLINGQPPGAN